MTVSSLVLFIDDVFWTFIAGAQSPFRAEHGFQYMHINASELCNKTTRQTCTQFYNTHIFRTCCWQFCKSHCPVYYLLKNQTYCSKCNETNALNQKLLSFSSMQRHRTDKYSNYYECPSSQRELSSEKMKKTISRSKRLCYNYLCPIYEILTLVY